MPPRVRIDGRHIQGNVLAGFNKDHQTFVLLGLPADRARARDWLSWLVPRIAPHADVAAFNALYRSVARRRGSSAPASLSAVWTNVAFTPTGLARFGHGVDLSDDPAAFREGLAHRAAALGHVGASAPSHWVAPFDAPGAIDAVLIVAGDRQDELEAELDTLEVALTNRGGVVLARLDGKARADLPGHEHFGFKDGVSQPGIRGVTRPDPNDPGQGLPGQDLIWPGEFVIGYPRQPGTGPSDQPGPLATAVPPWTRNGSFLVLQRLLQDVAGFESAVTSLAATHGLPAERLAAKLVGRHRSGCPVEVVDGLGDLGQTSADVSGAHPELLTDAHINDFDYDGAGDADGHHVPRAAHIRKAYPRDTTPPGEATSSTRRIIRRGIAFGEPYVASAPAGSPHHAAAERGLLFACYQSSIERQFEFIQASVADASFPQPGDGVDPILHESAGGHMTVPGAQPASLNLQPFVRMTGGAYFFAPSIPALKLFAR